MKVRVNITVEVDEKAWVNEYGIHHTEVRADVRAFIVDLVNNSSAAQIGLLKDGNWS